MPATALPQTLLPERPSPLATYGLRAATLAASFATLPPPADAALPRGSELEAAFASLGSSEYDWSSVLLESAVEHDAAAAHTAPPVTRVAPEPKLPTQLVASPAPDTCRDAVEECCGPWIISRPCELCVRSSRSKLNLAGCSIEHTRHICSAPSTKQTGSFNKPPEFFAGPHWDSVSTLEKSIPLILQLLAIVGVLSNVMFVCCCCTTSRKHGKDDQKDPDAVPPPEPHDKLSFIKMLTCSWVTPLLFRGDNHSLNNADMLPLQTDVPAVVKRAVRLYDRLMDERKRGVKRSFPSIFYAVTKDAIAVKYVLSSCTRLFSQAIHLGQPLILRYFLEMIGEEDLESAALAGGLYVTTSIFYVLFDMLSVQIVMGIQVELASIWGCLNFRRTMTISAAENARLGAGFVQQVWANDTFAVMQIIDHSYQIFSLLGTMIVAFVMLYHSVGMAAIAPIVVVFVLNFFDGVSIAFTVGFLHKLMYVRDSRVKLMNEFVRGIRTIKAGNLSATFYKEVTDWRNNELTMLRNVKIAGFLQNATAIIKVASVLACTLAAYMLLPPSQMCGAASDDEWCALDAPMVIAMVAYVELLAESLEQLPFYMGVLANGFNSLRRLSVYHDAEEAPCLDDAPLDGIFTTDGPGDDDPLWYDKGALKTAAAVSAKNAVPLTKGKTGDDVLIAFDKVTLSFLPSHGQGKPGENFKKQELVAGEEAKRSASKGAQGMSAMLDAAEEEAKKAVYTYTRAGAEKMRGLEIKVSEGDVLSFEHRSAITKVTKVTLNEIAEATFQDFSRTGVTQNNMSIEEAVEEGLLVLQSTNAEDPDAAKDAEEERPAGIVLVDLTMQIRQGRSYAVVGPSGCGKSSFLMALMRELTLKEGKIITDAARVWCAWAGQSATLRTGTVRDNILFDAPFDPLRYQQVVQACALDIDLLNWQHRDKTLVGDRGTKLSGGQRQRISLARACYSAAPVVLLDDPLAAVDAITAKHLHEQVLNGFLKGRTVVCVLNQLPACSTFDHVFVLDGGRLVEQGPPDLVEFLRGSLSGGVAEEGAIVPALARDDLEDAKSTLELTKEEEQDDLKAWVTQFVDAEMEVPERREFGNVGSSVFTRYLKAAGWWLCIFVVINLMLQKSIELMTQTLAVSIAAHDVELALHYLQRANASGSNPFFVKNIDGTVVSYTVPSSGPMGRSSSLLAMPEGMTGMDTSPGDVDVIGHCVDLMSTTISRHASELVAFSPAAMSTLHVVRGRIDAAMDLFAARGNRKELNEERLPQVAHLFFLTLSMVATVIIGSTVWMVAVLRAARTMHLNMLKSVLNAKIVFFDINPVGRLLNRFVSDTAAVDNAFPDAFGQLLLACVALLGSLTLVTMVLQWYMIALLPIGFLYYRISRLYLPVAIDCNRLSQIMGSRLQQCVAEQLEGAGALSRAYRSTAFAEAKHFKYVMMNQTIEFSQFAGQLWLGFTMKLVAVSIVAFIIVFALVPAWTGAHEDSFDAVHIAFIGLALNYAFTITGALEMAINFWGVVHTNAVSLERVFQYTDGLPSEPDDSELADVTHWPSRGEIRFVDVCMRFQPELPLVLHKVSFTINAGERVGVVGRTGSGKTSIVNCLLRLADIESGSIYIDGLDIRNVKLTELRTHIGVVMQDSIVFEGSVRRNLFAPENVTEEEMQQLLVGLSLAKNFAQARILLDTVIDFNQMSNGERQLVCIARMLVRKTKIMLLDEATSNMDQALDERVQKFLKHEVGNSSTVFTIAHRTRTIMESDRILVMQRGHVAEYDTPDALLSNPESIFKALVDAGDGMM
ncbi:hypothetical protein AB1Y20_006185 [Prymnesium parvum]|uniref:ATP-dependent transporter ycf16 n=1 Tax=Prymnesium parvum TaxID=97485 RepID=A0AB34J204_PRYPA